MKPSNMNKTESAAWDWLVNEKGYDPEEITREGRNQTPDFICPDASYEAKRPVGEGRFAIGERQEKILEREDPIIVVIEGGNQLPYDTFRWSEHTESGWVAKRYNRGTANINLKVSGKNRREWESIRAQVNPDATDDEIIEGLVEFLNADKSRIDAIRRNIRGPEYRGPS